jgi:cation transport protein ChaC
MTLLTRENLGDGHFHRRLGIPAHLQWSEARLAQSLADTWAQHPGGPTWVFGYGSLMWNPLIAFEAQQVATVPGWHRSFCMRTVTGRGSPEAPGRMLSLQPGGSVQGVAYRLVEADARAELKLLWAREMPSGAYEPRWVETRLADGATVRAITFVANAAHPQHEPDDAAGTVARLAAVAVGLFGPNAEYVRSLARALHERGLHDAYVDEVARQIEGRQAAP